MRLLNSLSESSRLRAMVAAGLGVLVGLLPPYGVAPGPAALAAQAVGQWLRGERDPYGALHALWLLPAWAIGLVVGDANIALNALRVVLLAGTGLFIERAASRMLSSGRHGLYAAAMVLCNIAVLGLMHTMGPHTVTLFVGAALLALFTSADERWHRFGALIFGLSLSIGFWPCILLLGILTVGLNLHHDVYTPRARATGVLLGYITLGAASYLLLEIFYFGAGGLFARLLPETAAPRGINLILQGVLIAVAALNLLLVSPIRAKKGEVAKDFQNAFVILGIFCAMGLLGSEEVLHAALLLVPCAVIAALDKVRTPGPFASIYLALNLGLYLFLPASSYHVEFALAGRRQTAPPETVAYNYYRTTAIAGAQQLAHAETLREEASTLLRSTPIDSTIVLITHGTDDAFDGATLAVRSPQAVYGLFTAMPINRIRINGLRDTTFIRPDAQKPYLAALVTREFGRAYLDSTVVAAGGQVHASEHLELITTRPIPMARKALIDLLIDLMYEPVRHH